jgi:exosortase
MPPEVLQQQVAASRASAPTIPVATPVARPQAPDREASAWHWRALFPMVALLPLLWVHAEHLWSRPQYQFFPFVFLGSFVIAWSRRLDSIDTKSAPGVALGLTFLSWFVLAIAEIFFSPALAAFSGIILVAAGCFAIGGASYFRTMLPAWLFLFLLLPLPFGLDRQLVLAMQRLTSRGSSAMLDYFGVYHNLAGNVVEITGRRLFVEEACAGVNSLFALLACSLFLVFWLRRPWIRGLILMMASVGWVLVANIVRVSAIAICIERTGFDLTAGVRHDALGLACFLLAVLLIWSTDRLLLFFVPRWGNDIAASPTPAPRPTSSDAPFSRLGRLVSWPVAIAFGVLLAFHLAVYGFEPQDEFASATPAPTMASIGKTSLPEAIGPWQRVEYSELHRDTGSAFGEHSKVWHYKWNHLTAVVSLDYPFRTFHDLSECYLNQGWNLERSQQHPEEGGENAPAFWIDMKFAKTGVHAGHVLYCEIDSNGTALGREGQWLGAVHRVERSLARLRERLSNPLGKGSTKSNGPVHQIQVFVETQEPLSAEELVSLRELHATTYVQLRRQLFR